LALKVAGSCILDARQIFFKLDARIGDIKRTFAAMKNGAEAPLLIVWR
jgi:hypothetical protein